MLDLESQVCYTVEDPVEYHLDNAYQIQVSEREGRSFADILKSLMRLDPDIVLLGEIRDKETAIIATQMANTGHSVFSTLHTNSAWTAAQAWSWRSVLPDSGKFKRNYRTGSFKKLSRLYRRI